MAHYDINIKATGDVMTALSAATIVAKALNVDNIKVDCGDGITVLASKDSRVVDLFNIYQLESTLSKLKKKGA